MDSSIFFFFWLKEEPLVCPFSVINVEEENDTGGAYIIYNEPIGEPNEF